MQTQLEPRRSQRVERGPCRICGESNPVRSMEAMKCNRCLVAGEISRHIIGRAFNRRPLVERVHRMLGEWLVADEGVAA